MDDNQELLYKKENGIASIIMNRPEKRNALSPGLFQGIFTSVEDAASDDEIKVIIITGKGEAFCSGADVKSMAAGELQRRSERPPEQSENTRRAPFARQFRECPKPIIAALNGIAVGVGLDLALSCDIRIASEKARFTVGYVRRGMVPAAGSAWFLPRLLGMDKALKVIWTSEMISAEEAEQLGLVTMVVPHDELEIVALDLAEQIAKAPTLAVQAAKRAVYESLNLDLEKSLELTMQIRQGLLGTQDFKESATAFVEKREPTFKGE
ncbi:MAG: enoyl-CoA hydratase/isomerase family protein [Dehalococcoidales bacterium]|nr:MAG: enoyl-CoA hydratase/isomerase family protein [Dehalococcoidales bacterium]